jgi:spermidine/putrescine-binding protein
MMRDEIAAGRILAALRHGRLSRREALSALTGAGLSVAALRLLGGDAWADAAGQTLGPGGIPLARPNRPVKLPLFAEPIKSDLKPETGGTFNIFNYDQYVDKKLLDAFGKKYGVTVQVTVFDSMDQAITKLSSNAVQNMDVTNIAGTRIAQAVAASSSSPSTRITSRISRRTSGRNSKARSTT